MHPLDGAGDRAGLAGVLRDVLSAIDARKDQVRRMIAQDVVHAEQHRIRRRASDGESPLGFLAHAHGCIERDGAGLAGLFLVRRDDPDVVGDRPCDVLQHGEAGGENAVVIGQEDAHHIVPPTALVLRRTVAFGDLLRMRAACTDITRSPLARPCRE
jgi:hypothetical protein